MTRNVSSPCWPPASTRIPYTRTKHATTSLCQKIADFSQACLKKGISATFSATQYTRTKHATTSLCQKIVDFSQACLKKGISATFSAAQLGCFATDWAALHIAATGVTLAEMALISPGLYEIEMRDLTAFYNSGPKEFWNQFKTRFNDPIPMLGIPLLCHGINLRLVSHIFFKMRVPSMTQSYLPHMHKAEIWTLQKLGLQK